jgi:hypothetical protein
MYKQLLVVKELILSCSYEPKSRDSSVGIALDYELDDRGFEARQGLGIFLFTTLSRPSLGPTTPPRYFSLGLKQSGCKADHLPPLSAEVKNACSYISTPQNACKAKCSVEER